MPADIADVRPTASIEDMIIQGDLEGALAQHEINFSCCDPDDANYMRECVEIAKQTQRDTRMRIYAKIDALKAAGRTKEAKRAEETLLRFKAASKKLA